MLYGLGGIRPRDQQLSIVPREPLPTQELPMIRPPQVRGLVPEKPNIFRRAITGALQNLRPQPTMRPTGAMPNMGQRLLRGLGRLNYENNPYR